MTSHIDAIQQLKEQIQSHDGMLELQLFGKNFENNLLDDKRIKIFMATLWAFFKETPSGILSLALRIHDDWSDTDPWGAMSKSAYALNTAIDEFGLDNKYNNSLTTHHQLFKKTAEYFDVSTYELLSEKNILPAGLKIGKASALYYRKKSLPISLGYHLASELTSWPEFKIFLSGFWANKEYYKITSQKDSALNFFWIHTILEPSHLNDSEKVIEDYLTREPTSIKLMSSGALGYMKLYQQLFKQLNKTLF
jgi:hypothetical protein